MFKLTILLLAASLAAAVHADVTRTERGNLVLEDIPEVPAELTQRLEQYQNTRSAGLVG